MPPALDVDWESVRTLAVAVGVREAARRMGLPEAACMQRSCREGWLSGLSRSERLPPTVMETVSSVRVSASQAMGDSLRDMSARTRLGHAKAAVKVADKVAQMDADELLTVMPAVLQSVKHAAVTHSWAAGNNGQPSVRLDLIAGSNVTAMRLDIGGSEAPEDDED